MKYKRLRFYVCFFAVFAILSMSSGCSSQAENKSPVTPLPAQNTDDGRFIPKLPAPASIIDVVSPSQTDSAEGVLSARSLEGLINKKQPRVYISENVSRNGIDEEAIRLDILTKYGGVKLNWLKADATHADNLAFWTLFEKYKAEIKNLYIYSDMLPDTINVAVMLAGQNEGIAVSRTLAGELASYNIPSVDVKAKYGFTDHIQINTWIKDNMVSKTNNKTVFMLKPSGRDSDSDIFPQIYDMAIATNSLIIHINPFIPKELELQKEILDQYPDNTLVIGWPGINMENDYVQSISAAGKSVVCSDWGFANGSLWASFPEFEAKEQQTPIAPTYKVDNNKTYVAFMTSDGDAWHCASRDLLALWNNPEHGAWPIGWTIPSLFSQASPLMLEYLYDTKTPMDEFVQGGSGYGYAYPSKMPSDAYKDFLLKTKSVMDITKLNLVNYWDLSSTKNAMVGDNEDLLRQYAEIVQPAAILRGHNGDGSYKMFGNTVVIQEVGDNVTNGVRTAEDIIRAVKRVRASTPAGEPAFVMINYEVWGEDLYTIPTAFDTLGEDGTVEFVKPSELVAAIRTYLKK